MNARLIFVQTLAVISIVAAAPTARATSFMTLHNFASGADGATPSGDLVAVSGTLYGTTYAGGAAGAGTIFSYNPATGKETVLYSFKGGSGGSGPGGGLAYQFGEFFGTTTKGGVNNDGTVFRFVLKTGKETVLQSFPLAAGASGPVGILAYNKGNLLGATSGGGSANDGTLYAVNAKTGATKVLYSFKGVQGAADGINPSSGLTDVGGAFYGTTGLGGGFSCGGPGCGTLYRYDPTSGTETVVHAFTATGDGMVPNGALSVVHGVLYGTTNYGPTFLAGGNIYQFNPGTAALKSLYGFTGGQGTGPVAGVTLQGLGIFGTLLVGGSANMGSIYKVGLKSGQATDLHDFSGQADGGSPGGRLIAEHGALYGLTSAGGTGGVGTLFKIVP